MRLFYTNESFEYFNIFSRKLEKTENKIPFIINYDGVLEEYANTFLLHKTEIDWNPKSRTPINNAEQIILFLEFCSLINKKWFDVTALDIRKWINHLSENGLLKTTIIKKISIVQHLFEWSYKYKIIENNPFLSFGIREVSRTIQVFSNKKTNKNFEVISLKRNIIQDVLKEDIPTKDELKNFYNFLPKEDKLMALFILETGVRKEELLQITIEMIENSISTTSGDFYILHLDARKMMIKNNKSRNIIISSSLKQKIKKHYKSLNFKNRQQIYLNKTNFDTINTPIFLSNRGNKYSTDKLNKSFNKASLLCGYLSSNGKSINPHQLRHFFASNFIASQEKDGVLTEATFIYLAERLGHSSPDTTKRHYIKIIDKIKNQKNMENYSSLFIANFLGE